jgi:hypothetical protein
MEGKRRKDEAGGMWSEREKSYAPLVQPKQHRRVQHRTAQTSQDRLKQQQLPDLLRSLAQYSNAVPLGEGEVRTFVAQLDANIDPELMNTLTHSIVLTQSGYRRKMVITPILLERPLSVLSSMQRKEAKTGRTAA